MAVTENRTVQTDSCKMCACIQRLNTDRDKEHIRRYRSTSAMEKILYISGKMTGATSGIWVSVTSRVNSAKKKEVVN